MKRRRIRRHPLLRLDETLAEAVPPAERSHAEAALVVPMVSVPRGAWDAPESPPTGADAGLLVISGQLVRRVEIGEGSSVELIGRGDLIRPWQEDASAFCVSGWDVLEAARLAVLDDAYIRTAAKWPRLQIELLARALRRSRFMAVEAAASNSVGIKRRLLTLLWQLAEKWGRLDEDGVVVTIKLTHRLLAELIGARRPTVTQALRELVDEGAVERLSDGCWALRRDLAPAPQAAPGR